MDTEKDNMRELVKINAEVGWNCDYVCQDCYRFFECSSPNKEAFYKGPRTEGIARNLSQVKHIVAVMSGKGGVGKSIISANLAVALAHRGYAVAIMDSDIYGPSIPSILGITEGKFTSGPEGMVPPRGPFGIRIVSMDFLLTENDPVTWLSDLKRSAQELFLANTEYGPLDFLIIDMPPGTGSETVNLFKYLPKRSGAIVVTMSSDIAEQVVYRCISFCQTAKVPIFGLIENMGGLACPVCGRNYEAQPGSSAVLSKTTGVPLLGKIARDAQIVEAADKGLSFLTAYPNSEAAKNFYRIVGKIEKRIGSKRSAVQADPSPERRQLVEIMQINAGQDCYAKTCYHCARYFECAFPQKDRRFQDSMVEKTRQAMAMIKHKIAVMSCKGGVGKSTIAANLAVALAGMGKSVVILDCDLHGPCIPKILGVKTTGLKIGSRGMVPILAASGVRVMSLDFLLRPEEAVTWFDPLKKMTIAQFLSNVDFGSADYLIIDLPPGTGAESYALLQCTPDLDGTVIVTLPSESPQVVTRRSIGLCRQTKVPILGLVENMSHFLCANCNGSSQLFGTKKAADLADQTDIPFLGTVPLDSNVLESSHQGVPFVVGFPASAATASILAIAKKIHESLINSSPGINGEL